MVWLDEESLWQHIRKENPGPAYRWLGRVQYEQGQYRSAALSYHLALKHQPNYPEAHLELGLAMNRLEEYEDAERHLRRALVDDYHLECGKYATAQRILGDIRQRQAEQD